MSWETLISGSIMFKEGTSVSEMSYLVQKIKNELELDNSPTYGAYKEIIRAYEFYFCHVNWSSHIDEERIEKLLDDIKDKIEAYDITLYYLDGGINFNSSDDDDFRDFSSDVAKFYNQSRIG
jgi:hypothetical protein